jgi:prepilin-type N-terminal cleavage/methylation domain-containing protein
MEKNKKAYTLIELIIVLAITVLLFAIGIGGMITGQRQFAFQANYERSLQLVRDARSLALNGRAFLDYTDYDRDGLNDDLMTPANIGVHFDTTAGTITMFADLHKGADDVNQQEGIYDPPASFGFYSYAPGSGKDVVIEQYTISNTLSLMIKGGPTTIFFSPIFADVSFNPALNSAYKFFGFGVKEKTDTRQFCSKIHPVSGVPEKGSFFDCNPLILIPPP